MTHFLITGHTGFKGTWLTLLLKEMGHSVSGISLDTRHPSLFTQCDSSADLVFDIREDVRNSQSLTQLLQEIQPEVVVHLAAQPLVSESYRIPRTTFETNTIGTFNILEASSFAPSVDSILIVTTDKVYRPSPNSLPSQEDDPLGGEDIYSASKAAADLVASAWAESFPRVATAVARGGNVIGGGDHTKDRLIPHIMNSLNGDCQIRLRNPRAVRPWQHVLDCLDGYLTILRALRTETGQACSAKHWNVGPGSESYATVEDVVQKVLEFSNAQPNGIIHYESGFKENPWLGLDSSKIQRELNWTGRLSLDQAIGLTVDWYARVGAGQHPRLVTVDQIRNFLDSAPA